MDGKGGQIMDLALPVGAAVASTYGPSYARGAAIGSQLYQQSRARRDEMQAGDRLSDTIMSLKGQDIDSQLALAQQERARLIDTGWEQSPDGRMMRVNDLGETEFTQDPANTFNPQVNPLYKAAETLAASGKVNQAANFLSQASAQSEAQRRQAIEVATMRERDEAQRQFQMRMNDIENEQQQALEDRRYTHNIETANRQFDQQKELFNLEVAENARQWRLNAPQRALENELMRAQITNAENASDAILLESLQADMDDITNGLDAVVGMQRNWQKMAQDVPGWEDTPQGKEEKAKIDKMRDDLSTSQKLTIQKIGQIRESLGLPSKPANENPIGPNDDVKKIDEILSEQEKARIKAQAASRLPEGYVPGTQVDLGSDSRFSELSVTPGQPGSVEVTSPLGERLEALYDEEGRPVANYGNLLPTGLVDLWNQKREGVQRAHGTYSP